MPKYEISQNKVVQKVVFIDKANDELKRLSKVMGIAERSGTHEQQGFHKTAPTIFMYVKNLKEIDVICFEMTGSIYLETPFVENESVRVFRLAVADEVSNRGLPIVQFLSLFPGEEK
jgi:hypothetical protein